MKHNSLTEALYDSDRYLAYTDGPAAVNENNPINLSEFVFRNPKTGLPLGTGAVQPNYFFEDMFAGGQVLSGLKFLTSSIKGAVWGMRAAKMASQAEYTSTKTAAKHLTEVVKRCENVGQLARPYMNSPLTVQEIMSTRKGTLDATLKGWLKSSVPSTFRESQGIWDLGFNPKTKVIYHSNFTHA